MKRGARYGQLYLQKVAKNFGQSAFLSACEIEHGRFRALFMGMLRLRYKMVEFRSKTKRSIQPSAFSQTNAEDRVRLEIDAERGSVEGGDRSETYAILG